MEFRGKEQRAKCYTARDAYFECFERTNDKASCQELFNKFQDVCGQKWTEHFIRKRDYMKFKERQEKEGDILDRMKKV